MANQKRSRPSHQEDLPPVRRGQAEASGSDASEKLEQLREILFGDEANKVEDLEDRLERIKQLEETGQVEALSGALPDAIALRIKDKTLSGALGPVVEESLHASIRRNPKPMVDALFPVIGPAIRKAIAEALSGFVDNMNRLVNHSVSVQSLKWRLEAKRTGKSFAEVVLAHTTNYKVEQIFLIDRKTSLPIQHVVVDKAITKDEDIVSSALQAVTDYMQDSFGATDEHALSEIDLHGMKMIVEQGPTAILAALVIGVPSIELRDKLKELLEAIHLQFGAHLATFTGNQAPFEMIRPLMKSGLLIDYVRPETPRRSSIARKVIGGVLLTLLIGFGLFLLIRNQIRWNNYLDVLRAEPGIVVTEAEKRGYTWEVRGLRDPLAADPDDLLAASSVPSDRVESSWEPYLALDRISLQRRLTRQLAPPETVTLRLRADTLFAAGVADAGWITHARARAPFLPGVTIYDDSGVMTGAEQTGLMVLNDEIESTRLLFGLGTTDLLAGQEAALDALVAALSSLSAYTSPSGIKPHVVIRGSTSPEGSESTNRRLSLARAETMRDLLIAAGIAPDMLTSASGGIGSPSSTEENRLSRRVTFEVRLP